MKDTHCLFQTYLKYGPVITPCVESQLLLRYVLMVIPTYRTLPFQLQAMISGGEGEGFEGNLPLIIS